MLDFAIFGKTQKKCSGRGKGDLILQNKIRGKREPQEKLRI